LMRLDGCDQQVRIIWPASVGLIIGDDLVLCLLQLYHLAELVETSEAEEVDEPTKIGR